MTPGSPPRLVGISVFCVLLAWPAVAGRAAGPRGLAQVEKTPVCVIKVVDAKGAPLAGVTVKAFGLDREDRGQTARRTTLIYTATSPKDGRLSFNIPVRPSLSFMIIVAHKKGLGLDWGTWWPLARSEFTLTPTGGAVLGGRVVDSAGSPVAGAEVRSILTIPGKKAFVISPGMPPFDLLVARTDAKGRFRFTDIPKAASAAFIVVAKGKAKTVPVLANGRCSRFRAGRTDIEIVVLDEARVSGKVVDKKTGSPVAGVCVTVHGKTQYGIDMFLPFFDEVITGADGEFTIGGLTAGRCAVVNLGPRTGLGDWLLSRVAIKVKAGQTTDGVKLVLVPGGVLEISVVDADTGASIADAHPIIDGRSTRATSVDSGREGIARMRLTPGDYVSFFITKFGYLTYRKQGLVTIVSGQTHKIQAKLRRNPMLRGVVLDPAGKPVSGAEITMMPSYIAASPYHGSMRTREEGRFAIFLRRDRSRRPISPRVVVRLPERNLVAAVKIEYDKTVEVRLAVGTRITGLVVDPEGKPIAGVKALVGSVKGGLFGTSSAVTDAMGRYDVRALLAGYQCSVSITAYGYNRARLRVDLPEKPEGPVRIEKVVLKPTNLSVSGVVLYPDGKPAVGAFVVATGKGQRVPTRDTTDEKGKFKIDKLCEGSIRLSAGKYGGPKGFLDTVAGKTDVEIRLRPRPSTRPAQKVTPAAAKGQDF